MKPNPTPSSSKERKCRYCKTPISGNPRKIFCSEKCKKIYHRKLKSATDKVVKSTDKILHRNRSTLLEIMGKRRKQKKVQRLELDKKKFNYQYCTGFYTNSKGKIYHYVYDFAWMEFTDQEILVVRKNAKAKDRPSFPSP